MARIFLAAIVAVTLTFFARVTLGQDDPHAEHAMPGEHSAVESGMHEGHGHEAGMEDYPEMHRQSFLMWLISSLGWKYTLLLPASALASFVLTGVLVIAGKGRTIGAATILIVAIPSLIGVFGTIEGTVNVAMVLRSDFAKHINGEAVSSCLMTTMVGMFLMVPSYLLATAGLTIRALKADPKP